MYQRVVARADGTVYTIADPTSTRSWEPEDPIPADLVAAAINRRELTAKIAAALSNNQDYLALAPPTATQLATQVKALTRQVNGLLRMVGERLDDVADT